MANEKRLIVTCPDDCIKKTKRKTNFARIIVSGTAEKPYYDIMWFDYMDGQYHIGYGSYNLNFVFQWLSDCFEVEDAPAIDAAPVVRGRWMIAGRGIRACSECNRGIREHMACVNHYCPNCGARMDGGSDNE